MENECHRINFIPPRNIIIRIIILIARTFPGGALDGFRGVDAAPVGSRLAANNARYVSRNNDVSHSNLICGGAGGTGVIFAALIRQSFINPRRRARYLGDAGV